VKGTPSHRNCREPAGPNYNKLPCWGPESTRGKSDRERPPEKITNCRGPFRFRAKFGRPASLARPTPPTPPPMNGLAAPRKQTTHFSTGIRQLTEALVKYHRLFPPAEAIDEFVCKTSVAPGTIGRRKEGEGSSSPSIKSGPTIDHGSGILVQTGYHKEPQCSKLFPRPSNAGI